MFIAPEKTIHNAIRCMNMVAWRGSFIFHSPACSTVSVSGAHKWAKKGISTSAHYMKIRHLMVSYTSELWILKWAYAWFTCDWNGTNRLKAGASVPSSPLNLIYFWIYLYRGNSTLMEGTGWRDRKMYFESRVVKCHSYICNQCIPVCYNIPLNIPNLSYFAKT